ncbi:MAG: PD-(D/E)XK nuclease family protein [Lachnospiraceae bacterium]|nr:PD-(D/E)XK nuclease family protein [Lachnospiraceae bacterium]
MNLADFLEQHRLNTKILLAEKVSAGNALLRQVNLNGKVSSYNTVVKTPLELAKEIIGAGLKEDITFVSDESCTYQMMNVLRKLNLPSFPDSALTVDTAKDILRRVNEVRENGTTPEFDADNSNKISDFKKVLDEYDEALKKAAYCDKAAALKKAVSLIDSEQSNIIGWVPYLHEAAFGDLETNIWSECEKEFLAKLASKAGISNEHIEFIKDETYDGYRYIRARGITNETRYVAQRILDLAGDESFGTAAVYYSSPEYVNFIKAVFDAEKIPYAISEGDPAMELYLTQMIVSVLDSAENDFSYELLENVVRNKVVTFENVIPEENRDSIRVNPIKCYRNALSEGIGWGWERYINYHERCRAESDKKLFADFLYDYATVFMGENENEKNLSIGEIYRRLWDFVQKYTYKRNKEKTALKSALSDKWNELTLIDSTNFSLQEKIAFIRDMIVNMRVEDTTDSDTTVMVSPINGLFVMERKHNFIMGMSALSFSVDNKQSPVLLDDEKKKFIKGADSPGTAVELAGKRNINRSRDVINSLSTRAADADVTFSYSYYDTVNLRDSGPSVFFLELLQKAGVKTEDVEKADGYDKAPFYMKNDFKIDLDRLSLAVSERESIIHEGQDTENRYSGSVPQQNNTDLSLSATGIQTLLACPLKYYYAYIKYLRIDEQKQRKGHEWLDNFNKGNLCHYFMEKYMSRVKNPELGLDEAAFDTAYEEALKEIEEKEPCYSIIVKDREKNFYKNKILGYLQFLHNSWKEDHKRDKKWRVIACELAFGKNDETGRLKPFYQGNGYTIQLNGSIDRVDGYMTDDGKLMLRIIDYKTGKKDNKQKELNENNQIQHYLYALALIRYLESSEGSKRIDEVFGKPYASYEFEWIGYTFPYEAGDDDRTLDVSYDVNKIQGNLQSGRCFPDEIADQLDMILGCYSTGRFEEASANMNELIKAKRAKDNEKFLEMSKYCEERYCDYQNICRKWVGICEEDDGEDE